MQLKLIKFHGVVHMSDAFLYFGVPMEVDTGSNESGHKATKRAARLTQKNETTFDLQTAIRLEEVHLLDMAMQEIAGRPVHNYGYHDPPPPPKKPPPRDNVPIGGAEFTIKFDDETQKNVIVLTSRSKDDADGDAMVETELVAFVADLQNAVQEYLPSVPLRTTHKRQGQIFRGQNRYRGLVWRDWAMIDWGVEGVLPNKIWGFVDLRALPAANTIHFEGTPLENSVYAIVENAVFVEDETSIGLSEIFVPISKQIRGLTHNAVSHMQFYLADVEAIVKAIAVIPDIGGQPNAYFMVKDRETWRTDFIAFLEKPLNLADEISDSEDDDS